LDNVVKPYPCGIVIHPLIDAAIALSPRVGDSGRIVRIAVDCHPLVVELTGNSAPRTGLQARFSAVHGIAAGLVDGQVGLPQYADARVTAADLTWLRGMIVLHVDERMPRDAVRIAVELDDGSQVVQAIDHARGSMARPMTTAEVREKVANLVEPVLPGRTEKLIRAVDALEQSNDVRELAEVVAR
ncbi:MAG: hypothetical protein ACRDQ1_21080, partial [Sciscionella sp.]